MAERYVELIVFLKRHENGFGFRIVGGTEEGSQVSVPWWFNEPVMKGK